MREEDTFMRKVKRKVRQNILNSYVHCDPFVCGPVVQRKRINRDMWGSVRTYSQRHQRTSVLIRTHLHLPLKLWMVGRDEAFIAKDNNNKIKWVTSKHQNTFDEENYLLPDKFIFKLPTPDAFPTCSISQWIASLNHEPLNHSVKDYIIIIPRASMTTEVFQCLRDPWK